MTELQGQDGVGCWVLMFGGWSRVLGLLYLGPPPVSVCTAV